LHDHVVSMVKLQQDDGRREAKQQCYTCRLGVASGPPDCPYRERVFEAGSCMTLPNIGVEAVWFIREGQVAVSSSTEAGHELSCCVRGPGAVLGIEALGRTPFRFEAWCLTDVTACTLTTDEFRRWLHSGDDTADTALACAAEEIGRRAAEREVLGGPTRVRIARLLCRAMPADVKSPWHPRIPASVLARILAVRPETISRSLTRLRCEGVLTADRRIVVRDVDQLRRVVAQAC
jgi:CRP-like cAMP-binding protein